MKELIFFLLISSAVYCQTVYEVVPGTTGNEVILSIVNESQTLAAEKLTVSLSNQPDGIELCNKLVTINKLKRGEEREALFSFDVKRIPSVAKDTLRFVITDNNGGSWIKEIILQYALPEEFRMEQNYPNPFNPSTTIEFTIPEKGNYSLSVYNILGQMVKLLSNEEYQPGYYKINFNAERLASGIYIYKLSGNNVNISKKMILVK